ncbi:putative uncharacterized protein [Clostridium sp. CAG:440]|nr:putative uncharacterized protein [Clostridium sp. CAG:440]
MKKIKKINDGIKFTIIAVVLIAIFCIAITPVTLQNDTYYTIKIGEHIQNNGIDMKDPFSWHEDLNYTYPHWLYDLLTYKIYSQFGMMGIYLTTCLLSCILGITLFFVSSKISKNKLISFFVTIGAMYLLKGYIAARAQLVTFILFILSLYFIEKFLENRKIRYGIGIVLISTLIANLHVAVWPFLFILFLPYIGEYLIAVLADVIIYKKVQEMLLKIKIKYSSNNKEALEKFQKELDELQAKVSKIKIKRSKSIQNPYKIKITKNKNVKWLILIMIICAFTGLLTPLGDTPYTYLAKTMQGNTTKNINEHLPMTIAEQPEVLCTIIIFLAVLTFTKIKIKLSDLFMIGGLAFLMLESRRQLSMFSLIGSVILSKLIVELITCYDKELLEKINKKILHPFIIICMIVLVGWQTYDNVKTKYNDKFIDETQYPVKACDYILENIDLSKARFYNEYNYGSYMIYRGIPVFIDSRADLYAPEFSGLKDDIFTDFIDVSSIGTFYEDILEKYNITHVILYSNSKMSMIIDETKDPHYSKIYKDDYFVIYERVK